MKLVERLAQYLSPEREAWLNTVAARLDVRERDLDMEVNDRVAQIVLKMDPFEPLMKKYNIVFSREWQHPEENLDDQSKIRLFQWSYGVVNDPSFLHVINFFRDTQGNATLRKAKTADEWFYGRSSIATLTLFLDEIKRLASHYEEMVAKKDKNFDPHSAVE